MKNYKKIISFLLAAVMLLACIPMMTFGATAAGETTYRRKFNYGTSAYGLYFYPEEAEDGTVTAKAHLTVASGYEKYYGVTEHDIDVTKWLDNTTFGVEDGFLKIGTTSTGVNSMGIKFSWTGILEAYRAKHIVVRYRILGKTLTAEDNKNIMITNDNHFVEKQVFVPVSNQDDGWNIAVRESSQTGNWITDTTVDIQFPDMNDTNFSIVLDYIGFCATEDDVNATKAAIEKANNPITTSVENRRYGTSAYGLYFYPEVAEDGTVTAKAHLTVASGYENYFGVTEHDINVTKWLDNTTFGVEDGFLKIGTTSTGVNSMGIKFSWTGILEAYRAKHIVVRYRILGKTLTAEDNKKIMITNDNNFVEKQVWVPVSNQDDGWNIAVKESSQTGNWITDTTVDIQFPDMNDTNFSIVLDYIGFCAEDDVKATKAAIDAANSIDIVGVQVAKDASEKALRFVGKVKAADIDTLNKTFGEIGFVLTAGTSTANVKITKVYKSIQANGETLEAGKGEYFFTFVVKDIPGTDTVNFSITPYVCLSGITDRLQNITATVGYNPTNNTLEAAKKN